MTPNKKYLTFLSKYGIIGADLEEVCYEQTCYKIERDGDGEKI